MSWDKNKIKKVFLLLYIISLYAPCVEAQTIDPIGEVVIVNGKPIADDPTYENEKTIDLGALFVDSGPIQILFKTRPEIPDNYDCRYEWIFSYDEDFSTFYDKKFDEDHQAIFNQAGKHYVKLIVTFTDENGESFDNESEGYFIVQVTESSLKVPNAFSPNGDGINDIFKVSYQSLVKFNAYVFNRWGQELYRWGMSNIDEGWDGTYKGKTVKDGVYFIVVEAEGSDGVKYKHKGDINVLKGLGDGNYSSGGSE